MGNCDSCVGGRERRPSSSPPFDYKPIKAPVNEIQYASGGDSIPNMVNYRILPFDSRPSIKIPDPATEKPPRKHKGI